MKHEVPGYHIANLGQKKYDTILIIPVINEGQRIISEIKKIYNLNLEVDVMIADGGSTDGSLQDRDFLVRYGVTVVLTKWGKGKLSAQLRMAFDYAIKQEYKHFITIDGNDKDSPSGVPKIQAALLQGFDFVQGSRFVEGGKAVNTPKLRDFSIRFLHAPLTSMAARRRFTDTTNGFRGYSLNLLQNSQMDIFREEFDSYELLFYLPIRSSRLKLRICEVPVIREYPRNSAPPTKIHGLRAYAQLFSILLKACMGRYNPQTPTKRSIELD